MSEANDGVPWCTSCHRYDCPRANYAWSADQPLDVRIESYCVAERDCTANRPTALRADLEATRSTLKAENQRAIDAEAKVAMLTAECDRLLTKVTELTVQNTDLKEERFVFGEDLDRAFTDGYGAAYIATRGQGFVPMAEYEVSAGIALKQWHRDTQGHDGDGGEVDPPDWRSCVSCGNDVPAGATHCGALECGGGRLPDVAPRRCCDLYPDCMHEVTGGRDSEAIDDTWSAR